MEEEYSVDAAQLLQAATDFAYDPSPQSDVSAQEFLDRFPLPAVINALQAKSDYPGLEDALCDCLDKVFRTKYGASLIPHFMPFVVVGLGAPSQNVRRLACTTVSSLLDNTDETTAVYLILQNGVYPLLLSCLIDGDEQVAAAAIAAIKNLAGFTKGLDIIFPASSSEQTHLGDLAAKCSSLGRVRVLALIVKLFSISTTVASKVYNANLLSLLEKEVGNANDTLVTLSALELLYELVEAQHSMEFLSRTTLLYLLSSIISNASADSILRSRAMLITGRVLSNDNAFLFIDEPSYRNVISAIDRRFAFLGSQDADEFECALEAFGQIGLCKKGAAALLSSSPAPVRHVISAAFDCQHHGKRLAALHALGNIVGETRSGNDVLLDGDAEESLRRLIYDTSSKSPKLTPSGLLLSVLQQDSEIRLAGYRVITGLVARPWCLIEIISRQEIVDIVTNKYTETEKIGMEARHKCCEAVYESFTSSSKLMSDPARSGLATKLEEAIRSGPYLGRKHAEAQPVVMTEQRF
ncbi:PREDICTED: uncharacterized protein LOC109192693 isoform X1 [Ipomoea nil]|uniref:uncharacterized protein LOC109192693 isoform X1 n=1 Tax=Ipomoea nil TaxID=35883 RepID=UPI0009012BA6|nr:PREDICTED: uncharacterized protein LOC109192693 isoform X1 [Ipomoea nil]